MVVPPVIAAPATQPGHHFAGRPIAQSSAGNPNDPPIQRRPDAFETALTLSSDYPKPTDKELIRFAKKLGIALGIHLVALVMTLPLLSFRDSVLPVFPLLLAVGAFFGMMFTAQIWLAILGFQKSPVMGLLVLFAPYVWMIFAALNWRHCAKPLMLLATAWIPLFILFPAVMVLTETKQNDSPGVIHEYVEEDESSN